MELAINDKRIVYALKLLPSTCNEDFVAAAQTDLEL